MDYKAFESKFHYSRDLPEDAVTKLKECPPLLLLMIIHHLYSTESWPTKK